MIQELNWKRRINKWCPTVHWSFFFCRLCICMTCNALPNNLTTHQAILLCYYFQIKQPISVCMTKNVLYHLNFLRAVHNLFSFCWLQFSNVKYAIICIFWRSWFILCIYTFLKKKPNVYVLYNGLSEVLLLEA